MFKKILPAAFFAYGLLVLVFCSYFPLRHWLAGLLAFTIPLVLLVSAAWLLWAARHRRWQGLLPLLLLVLGLKPAGELVSFSLAPPAARPDLTVMSYNVGSFSLGRFALTRADPADSITPAAQLAWLRQHAKADVLCFQEFFNNDKLAFESTLSYILNLGYNYAYTNPIANPSHDGFFGVTTFSKYPIVAAGALVYGPDSASLNRGIYTDIRVGKVTVRVFNVHLQSMSIRAPALLGLGRPDRVAAEGRLNAGKLARGIRARNASLARIDSAVRHSPHRVVLCGDFNDVPLSYSYQSVKRLLTNSFEESGRGFGFTYNRFPWFIRIDNQFHDRGLRSVGCRVRTDNRLSDHFPIEAAYVLTPPVARAFTPPVRPRFSLR